MIKKLLCVLAVGLFLAPATADAAIVGFRGELLGGNPGGLGSLPRNFSLTLSYVDGVGSQPGIATFEFPATPNGMVTNPDVNYGLSTTSVSGNLVVINDIVGMSGLEDRFSYTGGVLPANNGISADPINFSFTFVRPADTVDSNLVNAANIARLIAGAPTTISLTNASVNPSGTIQAAPEPGTMLALTGLVLGGCGIGYRRRKQRNEAKANDAE